MKIYEVIIGVFIYRILSEMLKYWFLNPRTKEENAAKKATFQDRMKEKAAEKRKQEIEEEIEILRDKRIEVGVFGHKSDAILRQINMLKREKDQL